MKVIFAARISYFHRVKVHVLQHLWIPITAYIQHDVFLITSFELIDDVEVKKRLRNERIYNLTRLPRDHVDESLIIETSKTLTY